MLAGAGRFVSRVWRLLRPTAAAPKGAPKPAAADSDPEVVKLRQQVHKAIAGVTADLEDFHFNKAVARIYELVNALADFDSDDESNAAARWARREAFEILVRLAGPMMPHLAEALWQRLGCDGLLADAPWPAAEKALLVEDTVNIAVQVMGKLRATVAMPRDAAQADAEKAALDEPSVLAAIGDKAVRRIIFVPNRIINFVIG